MRSGDQVAEAAHPEVAGQHFQGDAGLDREQHGEDGDRDGDGMRRAEQGGQQRDGEHGVPPQTGGNPGWTPGREQHHAQPESALPQGSPGAEQSVRAEDQGEREERADARVLAHEEEREQTDEKVECARQGAAAG